MNAFLYLLFMDLSCIASGTFLVYTDHPGWAWIPFLIAAGTTIKQRTE
jgi:hypothetical protein